LRPEKEKEKEKEKERAINWGRNTKTSPRKLSAGLVILNGVAASSARNGRRNCYPPATATPKFQAIERFTDKTSKLLAATIRRATTDKGGDCS